MPRFTGEFEQKIGLAIEHDDTGSSVGRSETLSFQPELLQSVEQLEKTPEFTLHIGTAYHPELKRDKVEGRLENGTAYYNAHEGKTKEVLQEKNRYVAENLVPVEYQHRATEYAENFDLDVFAVEEALKKNSPVYAYAAGSFPGAYGNVFNVELGTFLFKPDNTSTVHAAIDEVTFPAPTDGENTSAELQARIEAAHQDGVKYRKMIKKSLEFAAQYLQKNEVYTPNESGDMQRVTPSAEGKVEMDVCKGKKLDVYFDGNTDVGSITQKCLLAQVAAGMGYEVINHFNGAREKSGYHNHPILKVPENKVDNNGVKKLLGGSHENDPFGGMQSDTPWALVVHGEQLGMKFQNDEDLGPFPQQTTQDLLNEMKDGLKKEEGSLSYSEQKWSEFLGELEQISKS